MRLINHSGNLFLALMRMTDALTETSLFGYYTHLQIQMKWSEFLLRPYPSQIWMKQSRVIQTPQSSEAVDQTSATGATGECHQFNPQINKSTRTEIDTYEQTEIITSSTVLRLTCLHYKSPLIDPQVSWYVSCSSTLAMNFMTLSTLLSFLKSYSTNCVRNLLHS